MLNFGGIKYKFQWDRMIHQGKSRWMAVETPCISMYWIQKCPPWIKTSTLWRRTSRPSPCAFDHWGKIKSSSNVAIAFQIPKLTAFLPLLLEFQDSYSIGKSNMFFSHSISVKLHKGKLLGWSGISYYCKWFETVCHLGYESFKSPIALLRTYTPWN